MFVKTVRCSILLCIRSETAIAELDNKYGAVSTRVACNITGNREDAKECVNDAYLGVWNTVPPAKPNPLVAYLLRIVRNIAVNRFIHNSRQKRNLPFYECAEELEYCIKGREDTESIGLRYLPKPRLKPILFPPFCVGGTRNTPGIPSFRRLEKRKKNSV